MRLDLDLYRQEAIDHQLALRQQSGSVASLSPTWTWWVLGGTTILLTVALVLSVMLETEVTGSTQGVLSPAGGIQLLTADTNGRVVEVLGRSGDILSAGTVVIRLSATDLQADLAEAEGALSLLDAELRSYEQQQRGGFDAEQRLIAQRLSTLTEQLISYEQSMHLLQRKLAATQQLRENGLVGSLAVADAEEAVTQGRRQLNTAKLQLTQVQQELATLSARRRQLSWETTRELAAARRRADTARKAIAQTTIHTPQAGLLEAITVKHGDTVERGQTVGEVIPTQATFVATAFLPEQDRAFLAVGDSVTLEINQLPHLEFGRVQGRIARIAESLALPHELADAGARGLSPAGPSYRLEIDTDAASVGQLGRPLRSGMLVDIRYVLRRQKLLTLVLAPLRRWLDG